MRIRNFIVFSLLIAFSITFLGSLQPLTGQIRQLSLADILIALRSKKAEIDEKNRILADAVKDRGITFSLTPEIEKELDSTGARTELIAAIRSKNTPPPTVAVRKADPPKIVPPESKIAQPVQDFQFFRDRAATSLKKGDIGAGISDLGKALELKPGDIRTTLDRGQAYAKLDKTDPAMADLEKAISIDPKSAEAFYSRGQLYEHLGKIEQAAADYGKAFELDPANDVAKMSVARVRKTIDDAAKKLEPVVPPVTGPTVPVFHSVGALNTYATYLSQPVYAAEVRRMNIFGRVTVQISLDEKGKLTSVRASDGPRPLRIAAEDAIRRSKFKPVMLGSVPVLATGYIIFNFTNQ